MKKLVHLAEALRPIPFGSATDSKPVTFCDRFSLHEYLINSFH
jgi:hypothetical protein